MIRTSGKPVIARINGVVAGGGNEINLACDLSIAAEHARFIQPGTRTGSVSAGGVFEVKGYWNEMHLPDLMVQRFEIKKGDSLKFVLHQIINHGETTNF